MDRRERRRSAQHVSSSSQHRERRGARRVRRREQVESTRTCCAVDPPELPSAFPTAPNTTRPASTSSTYQQQTTQARPRDRRGRRRRSTTANANASVERSPRRCASTAAPRCSRCCSRSLLIWFVSRAVVRPLRKLTAAAREMSQRQLPRSSSRCAPVARSSAIEPVRIEVQSEDEIGELAQAFNDVEAVTLQVAQEQSAAAAQGHGRPVREPRPPQPEPGASVSSSCSTTSSATSTTPPRSTRCSSSTTWPPACAATRRACSCSRARSSRASGSSRSRLLDVVRAAAAEIADFPRVELVGVDDDLAVSGRAVVRHRAPPRRAARERDVVLAAGRPPSSCRAPISATGFVLAVSDQGIGMPPDRIAEANQLLAKPPVVGLALSRALGLHVVGVAGGPSRHHVELRPGAPVGLVALVTLPTAVLEREAAPRRRRRPCSPRTTRPTASRPTARRAPRGVASRRRAAGGGVALRGSGRPVPPTRPDARRARRRARRSAPRRARRRRDRPSTRRAARGTAAPCLRRLRRCGAADRSAARRVRRRPRRRARVRRSHVRRARHSTRRRVDGAAVDDAPARRPIAEEPFDDAPLPTRVPGHHLSHQPTGSATTRSP